MVDKIKNKVETTAVISQHAYWEHVADFSLKDSHIASSIAAYF